VNRSRFTPLLLFVAALWIIRTLDAFHAGGSVAGMGVVPRSTSHLTGIVTAPFIHASWGHLVSNTLPLLLLGWLVALEGAAEWMTVTVFCALTAGLGSWLFGSGGNHVGASGIVFGYVGYLLFRGWYDRKPAAILVTLLVAAMYGTTLLWSIIPRGGISWTAHAFGFLGGLIAARVRGATPSADAPLAR
jgi:membrane associated rhomboid family serine protease